MRTRKKLFILLLAMLACLTLFSSFFHTESTIENDNDCPICNWQRNVIAISQLSVLFLLVLLYCLFKFLVANDRLYTVVPAFHLKNRAPPTL